MTFADGFAGRAGRRRGTGASTPLPRVFVVENEPPISRLVASYLESEGFEVDVTYDGEHGV